MKPSKPKRPLKNGLKNYWVNTRLARELLAVALATAFIFTLIFYAVYTAEEPLTDLERKDRHLQQQINQLKNELEQCKNLK